jgi:hypothetical protein
MIPKYPKALKNRPVLLQNRPVFTFKSGRFLPVFILKTGRFYLKTGLFFNSQTRQTRSNSREYSFWDSEGKGVGMRGE